jgi:hypothetical protein
VIAPSLGPNAADLSTPPCWIDHHEMNRILACACLVCFATFVGGEPDAVAQAHGSADRPIPPRLRLAIRNLRCEMGGARPAISVFFDATSPVRLTSLSAGSLMIAPRHGGWSRANTGALEIRAWSDRPGTPSASPLTFDGSMAAGTAMHLQVFATLSMMSFGSGETYPTGEREFRLVLQATEGVLQIDGRRCVVTPAR